MKSKTKRLVAGAAAIGIGLGGLKAAEAGGDAVVERNKQIAATAPAVGDICVIQSVSGSAEMLADRFADGTDIGPLAERASIISSAHDGEVAICRPENAQGLDDNEVVNPDAVSPDQTVSLAEYNEAGGVSKDVG